MKIYEHPKFVYALAGAITLSIVIIFFVISAIVQKKSESGSNAPFAMDQKKQEAKTEDEKLKEAIRSTTAPSLDRNVSEADTVDASAIVPESEQSATHSTTAKYSASAKPDAKVLDSLTAPKAKSGSTGKVDQDVLDSLSAPKN
jgi:hypothetical protein